MLPSGVLTASALAQARGQREEGRGQGQGRRQKGRARREGGDQGRRARCPEAFCAARLGARQDDDPAVHARSLILTRRCGCVEGTEARGLRAVSRLAQLVAHITAHGPREGRRRGEGQHGCGRRGCSRRGRRLPRESRA